MNLETLDAKLRSRILQQVADEDAAKVNRDPDHPRLDTVVQKQQAGDPGQQDGANANPDRSKDQKEDAGNHPRFKLTISVGMCDQRRRDLDGCLATILDCLVAAGRLLAGDPGDCYSRKKSKLPNRNRDRGV